MAKLPLISSCYQLPRNIRCIICVVAGLVAIASGFEPFAGLAELSPQRLADFCSEDGGDLRGMARGVRRCVQSLRRRLEDGGEVEFRWQLDVDPTRIFSLDVENSVARLIRCNANELELEIPRVGQTTQLPVKEGDCVVASRWTHNCPHLHEKNLYHCVLGVEEINSADAAQRDVSQLRLLTMEVPSLAHLADAVDFYISYTPPEAKEVVRFPRQQTGDTSSMPAMQSDGEPGQSLRPSTVANLGWNWDFDRNATQTPEVKYAVPGGQLTLQEAYAKAHVGIFLNFTSRFSPEDLVPRINFELGMDGHATVNARLITELDAAGSDAADSDLSRRTDIQVLEQLAQTRWLGQLDFSVGSIPVSFEPGFQFTSSAHKLGQFRGSLQMGVNAHALVRPRMRFSSINGLDAACVAELQDVRLSPPMWMISTRYFEMGMQLEPQLWIRGQLGGVENIKASLALLPFANVTIRRTTTPDAAQRSAKGADDQLVRRRLWSVGDWEARLANQDAHCQKDRVHFGLDAGLLVRGEVEHMKLPSAFPQIGWLQTDPEKAIRYSFAEGSHGGNAHKSRTLGDLLPEACAGGLCEGTLTACADGASNFFEQITWHFNRPFHWDGSSGNFADRVRSDIAHAFSILPADMEVRLPRSSDSWKSHTRRLSGWTAQAGQKPASSVVTTFKEGLTYVADRPLIEMLLSHGSLNAFDDGLQHKQGALYITGFSLEREEESTETQSDLFAQALFITPVLFILCGCACILIPKKRRRPASSAVYNWLQSTPMVSLERDQESLSDELAAE